MKKNVTGGGIQGGTTGILEFISLTKGNLDFVGQDQGFKFADDSSCLEVLNLLSLGLSSYNAKYQVPSDVATSKLFLPTTECQTQTYFDKIA